MRFRLRQHLSGSAPGEQLILYALMALCLVGLVAVFSQSVLWGFIIVGISLATGLLVLAFGYYQLMRAPRRRVEQCRTKLEKAAAAHNLDLDAVFLGEGEGATTGFGVAAAARKLVYAHNGYRQPHLAVFDFGELAAAFARPDGKRYRVEARMRAGDGRAPRAALFLRVEGREEAECWIRLLKPYLGERARFVEAGGGEERA